MFSNSTTLYEGDEIMGVSQHKCCIHIGDGWRILFVTATPDRLQVHEAGSL